MRNLIIPVALLMTFFFFNYCIADDCLDGDPCSVEIREGEIRYYGDALKNDVYLAEKDIKLEILRWKHIGVLINVTDKMYPAILKGFTEYSDKLDWEIWATSDKEKKDKLGKLYRENKTKMHHFMAEWHLGKHWYGYCYLDDSRSYGKEYQTVINQLKAKYKCHKNKQNLRLVPVSQ